MEDEEAQSESGTTPEESNPFSRSTNYRSQECLGYYGYGTGREAAHMAHIAKRYGRDIPGVCDNCIRRMECWKVMQQRVTNTYPGEVANWDQRKAAGAEQGMTSGQVAVQMAAEGNFDPWMKRSIQYMQWGVDDSDG